MPDDESVQPMSGVDQSALLLEPLPFDNNTAPASLASHAARNPMQPVIQPRKKKKQSVDKTSKAVARQVLQEKQAEFILDLEAFQEMKQEMVNELALKHHKKPEYMEALLTQQSLLKKQRAPNIQNAKIFHKAKEMNEGRMEGDKVKLPEIQAAVRDDPALQNLSEEEKNVLLREFEEAKAVKKAGVRINNKAANLDAQNTVNCLENEINALSKRTGVAAFAFFSRSHVNDSIKPCWTSTAGALEFLPEALNTSSGEVVRKFKLWAVTKNNKPSQSELVRLQSECAEMILQGLRGMVKRRDISMSYRYYDTDIRARWKVQLRGWPLNDKFVAPGNITVMYEIRKLQHALFTGECRWVAMTPGETAALAAKLNENPVVKTRKPRKRKSKENTSEGQGEDVQQGTSKRTRRSRARVDVEDQ